MWLLAAAALAAPPAAARFDLELRDAEVHTTIRMLADLGDLDVVVPDAVHGTVSIRLVDVTWETALAAVLMAEGLGAVSTGANTLRITPPTRR